MNYAIRITFPASRLEKFFSRLALHVDKLVVYEHDERQDNIHCHLIAFGYRGDEKNIKRWAEEALNLLLDRTKFAKKTKYSAKDKPKDVPVDEGAVSYASRGWRDPKYVKGFSVEEIAALKAQGFDKKDKSVKKSDGDLGYYSEFEAAFMSQSKVPTDEVCFYDLRSFAVSWNFKKLQVVNQNYKNKVKMCVQTFMMTYGTKVPGKDKDAIKKYIDF